jgi:hypothetical protein
MRRWEQTARSEEGYALVFVIFVLVVASLMIPPLLKLSFSGMRGAQIGEQRASRMHAADAGVEDAIYRIGEGIDMDGSPTAYSLGDEVNGCGVDVSISPLPDSAYRVSSTAIGAGGIASSVDSLVYVMDYAFLTEYALVTNGDLSMQPGTKVTGDVRYQYDGVPPDPDLKGRINGDVTTDEPVQNWPQAQRMAAFYWEDVEGLVPESSYNISGSPDLIGPLYLHNGGDEVRITSDKNKLGRLEGTVYVKGDLRIDLADDSLIDLNSQTVFVEGNVSMQPGTPLLGPGCIIATGDIAFLPNHMNTGFILVLSLEGAVAVQPGSDFYGSLAAADGIFVQPGGWVINPGTPPAGVNFPGLDDSDPRVAIASYTIGS